MDVRPPAWPAHPDPEWGKLARQRLPHVHRRRHLAIGQAPGRMTGRCDQVAGTPQGIARDDDFKTSVDGYGPAPGCLPPSPAWSSVVGLLGFEHQADFPT